MSAIPATSSNYSDLGLGLSGAAGAAKKDLGQADFLRLMTEQLKNQDPLKPLSNTEFLGQLAQFSQVQGIQDMQASLQMVAGVMASDQSLRAASLVGHQAQVVVDKVALSTDGQIAGEIAATGTGTIDVRISDASGKLVRRISIDAASAGTQPFVWNGRDDNGVALPAGSYGIQATLGTGADAAPLETTVAANIDSVSLSAQGLMLNLGALGSWPLSALRRLG